MRAGVPFPERDETWSKLAMEGNLLLHGTASGLKNSYDKMAADPEQALVNAGLVAGSAAALSVACQLGGVRFCKATQIALGLALAYDLGSRAIGTVSAMSEAWYDPEKKEAAHKAIASNLGEGLVDYALNGTISAGAFHLSSNKVNQACGLWRSLQANIARSSEMVPVRSGVLGKDFVQNQNLPADSPLRQLWLKGKDLVVKVEGLKPERGIVGGSGFFVGEDGLVATNYHVISQMKNPAIVTENGQKFAVQLVARDKFNDLALIRVTDAPVGTVFPAASISTADGAIVARSSLAPMAKLPPQEPVTQILVPTEQLPPQQTVCSPPRTEVLVSSEHQASAVGVIGFPSKYGRKVISAGEIVDTTGSKRSFSSSPFLDSQPLAETYLSRNRIPGIKNLDGQVRPPSKKTDTPYIRREIIVHDALASPGSSGSPVFDLNGDVIAIHSNGGCKAVSAKHLDALIKQANLTSPGDGWLDVISHVEPASSGVSGTADVIRAKIRNRWSLAEAVRDDLESQISANQLVKNLSERRWFLARRVMSAGSIAAIDSKIVSAYSAAQPEEN